MSQTLSSPQASDPRKRPHSEQAESMTVIEDHQDSNWNPKTHDELRQKISRLSRWDLEKSLLWILNDDDEDWREIASLKERDTVEGMPQAENHIYTSLCSKSELVCKGILDTQALAYHFTLTDIHDNGRLWTLCFARTAPQDPASRLEVYELDLSVGSSNLPIAEPSLTRINPKPVKSYPAVEIRLTNKLYFLYGVNRSILSFVHAKKVREEEVPILMTNLWALIQAKEERMAVNCDWEWRMGILGLMMESHRMRSLVLCRFFRDALEFFAQS